MSIAVQLESVRDAGIALAVAAHAAAADVLAVDPSTSPTPAPGPNINTDGIVDFLATRVAPIMLAILGIVLISRAGKGELGKALTSVAIAVIGLAFIAGATVLFVFGQGVVELVLPTP